MIREREVVEEVRDCMGCSTDKQVLVQYQVPGRTYLVGPRT